MLILGIETSCDETAAAVVRDGRQVLSSIVSSQTALHQPYGGVVPEIAARAHVEQLPAIVVQAMERAGAAFGQLDAVAVTYGPGLASSLLVGLTAAKALALRLGKPLCAINHLEAHLYSVFLEADGPAPEAVLPFLALVVSGGHSCLVRAEGLGQYTLLGQTLDDAAGEAFDKGANLLGLGYPGGPAIDRASQGGKADAVPFPRGRQKRDRLPVAGLNPELCFSFSGLKTALLYHLRNNPVGDDPHALASVAASFQEAIVDALVERCEAALTDECFLVAGGGVSLNRRLREKLTRLAQAEGVGLLLAKPRYCGDNAAMIAGLAGAGRGIWGAAAMAIDVMPNLPVAEARADTLL